MLDYYDRPAGFVCCDASHVIRTKSECTSALKSLGYQANFNNYWSAKSSGDIPFGCSIREIGTKYGKSEDRRPHLETSPYGVGTGREDLIPICKGQVCESKYYQRPAGQVCDNANHVIRSKSECTAALKSLGFQANFNNYWSNKSNGIPFGCSIRRVGTRYGKSEDSRPHLETHPDGVGKGREDLIPICRI